MVLTKPLVLRMFISHKYITANIIDRTRSRVIISASSMEKPLKQMFECKRTCNAKAAAVVGEVLAMRIKVKGLPPIYSNIQKELDKGLQHRTKVWALINALRSNDIKIIDDNGL